MWAGLLQSMLKQHFIFHIPSILPSHLNFVAISTLTFLHYRGGPSQESTSGSPQESRQVRRRPHQRYIVLYILYWLFIVFYIVGMIVVCSFWVFYDDQCVYE